MNRKVKYVVIVIGVVALGMGVVALSIQLAVDKNIEQAFIEKECDLSPQPRAFDTGAYYTGPLIDAHVHMPMFIEPPPGVTTDAGSVRFAVLGKDVTMGDIICLMDQENIKKMIGFFITSEFIMTEQSLRVVRQTEEKYPNRIVPFLMPMPLFTPLINPPALDQILSSNNGLFKGYGELALYFDVFAGLNPDDAVFLETYTVLDKHNLIVMIHPVGGQVDTLKRVVENNPDVRFLFHGGDEVADYITDLLVYPNVYYSIDGELLPNWYDIENKEEFITQVTENFDFLLDENIEKWKEKIRDHPDQFMWGTDRGGYWHFDEDVGRLIEEFSRAFIARLDPEVQDRYAYKNAERLLNF